MKTVDYIELLTESVTAMTNVFDLIKDHIGGDCSGEPVELQNNVYLALAYTMDTFRFIWNAMPEALVELADPEANKVMKKFYLHLNKDGDMYQLNTLRSDASLLHSVAYKLWEGANEAKRIYEF
jgi:hypothetical protein